MYIYEAMLLVAAHYVSDFLAQTKWMAENKSKSNLALSIHIYALSLVLLIFLSLGPVFAWSFLPFSVTPMGIMFLLAVNSSTHWFIDYVSSRAMRRAWEAGDKRRFFKILGLDQALHVGILFASYILARDLGGVIFG